ncbi:ParB/RepB/Spo0J family partition protein [Tautonia plasticadhaerens]|uniref:Chromosome-partitioning protein ParB n=1 Tax=Tautonia plasticadhaerens TaxID=2527974 RepID=A0A518HEX1_9BACT|nr:ParB/RepB/Spo0J family partition protein [Tautonia plasticadhaerens]QDV39393.1 Chromosome-partitioning protein ParB [Tautonia plasticadhaerens]
MSRDDDKKRAGVLSNLGIGRAPAIPAGMAPLPDAAPHDRLAERGAFLRRIPVEQIEPDPDQPRKRFDEAAIEEMAESLKVRGQLQAVAVYRDEGRGAYLLVFGERRWRGAKRAGLTHLDCKVLPARPSEPELRTIQLVENIQRADLKPCERAAAFKAIMDAHDWSANRLAQELGVPQQSVSSALSLLKLAPELRERIDAGSLAPTIGHELARLDDEAARAALLTRIEADGLKRDEVAAAVKASNSSAGKSRGDTSGRAKGGHKGKSSRGAARKVTRRVLKLAGYKVTIERAKGLDDDYCQVIAAALLAGADPDVERESTPGHGGPMAGSPPLDPGPVVSGADDEEQGREVAA